MQFLFQYVQGCIYGFYLSSFLLWLRQCLFVHLLVLVEGNGIYLHRHGRHHIRWFLVEDEVVQSLDVYLLIADDVGGNELTISSFLVVCLYRSILDAWEFTNHALHLFQFDAEATNLHLTILSSDELDIPVGQVAHNVACAIAAGVFPGISGKRILNIHLCRLLRTVQIASTHLWTADPKLAGSTNRQTVSLRVNDIEAHIVNNTTNGYILLLLLYWIDRYENCGLSWTIYIN